MLPTDAVIRNSRIALALLSVGGVFSVAFGVLFMLMAVAGMFPLSELHGARLAAAGATGATGFYAAVLGRFTWRMARAMVNNEVRLDAEGARCRFPTGETSIRWSDVTGITQDRTRGWVAYNIGLRDGSEVRFTSTTFLRPNHVALRIAAGSGQQLTKVRRK